MSLIGWLFGADKLQAEGDRLDGQLAAMNQRDYAPGGAVYTKIEAAHGTEAADAAAAQVNSNLTASKTGNVDEQINQSFDEGWQEGQNNVSGFIKGTLNRIIADPFKAIVFGLPWWVWVLGIGFLLWKFGLLNGLWRRVKTATQ